MKILLSCLCFSFGVFSLAVLVRSQPRQSAPAPAPVLPTITPEEAPPKAHPAPPLPIPGPGSALVRLPERERRVALSAAARNGLTVWETEVLVGIRLVENGGKGREFGVLDPRALDRGIDVQAGWAAATVRRNRDRFVTATGRRPEADKAGYVTFLAARYCPLGAGNDPGGLNRNWRGNMLRILGLK